MNCRQCGNCCKVFHIAFPKHEAQYNELIDAMSKDTLFQFVDIDKLELKLTGRCRFLDKSNLCTRYETRFEICKKFWCDRKKGVAHGRRE